uniref:Integrase, catalytic region, zinc finger, CCHC-type, peptidase aspartic, catalytic n=1 Tax=Tanacetum cinerariifolium TaxID=118510 RepID=A0A6L2NYY2_TANCI|nr:hypothetical protein [Tanacetum cinerariifolium]
MDSYINMLKPGTYEYTNERAFEALFEEEFDSFKEAFVHNVDRVHKQLNRAKFHESDSKTCLVVLKKQFETFFDQQSPRDSFDSTSNFERQEKIFQRYARYRISSFKSVFQVRLSNIERGKCSSPRENMDAEDGHISKDVSENDNVVAKASYDKDNITEDLMIPIRSYDYDLAKPKTILNSAVSNVTLETERPQKSSSPPKEMPKQSKLLELKDIQCAGSNHDHFQKSACVHHEEHVMHDCVQLDHIVNSHDDYTSDSNIILCDQYVKDNEVPVVHSDLSYVPDDAFMMIYDDMCEPHDQPVFYPSRNTVVKNSLTAELAIYKEHVELVAIGYKKPLCLTRTKQVQPALYNGHEIIKDNHTPAIVHNSEDTLEIAEITRKKMNDKMNDPECVTRKDNFEGIQNALTKEVKEMKDVFEELEAEVAQYAIDRKHDAIELKNLLIANDNLIDECLSQEVLCMATNSELKVARLTEMHVANITAETRCLALEAELANLRETNNHDNQKELINHFSKLEAQNDLFRAENDKIKQHYKELYDSIKITRAKHIEQKTNVHVPPSTGVNSCPNASGSQPKSHVKANRISPAKGDNKLPVDDQPRKISPTLEHRIVLILVVALSAL